MLKQIENFKDYIGRLKGIAGEAEAMNIVTGSLVVISAGTNDFGFNFYDVPTRRQQYPISGYQYFLQGRIKDSVKVKTWILHFIVGAKEHMILPMILQ